MVMFVFKFNFFFLKFEIVFVCDCFGFMGDGKRILNFQIVLYLFLKFLLFGVKFNICFFGFYWDFMFLEGFCIYDVSSLVYVIQYVNSILVNYGGIEMCMFLQDIFKRWYKDMDFEVFMLIDGEIWD